MAESRRVPLTSLSCGRPSFSDVLVPSGVTKENLCDRPTDTRTVRLVLKLFDPDEQKFPEFNYHQLLGDKIRNPEEHLLTGFTQKEKEEIAEVADIARKFEEKYGGMYKKDRIQDLIDIGYGYDDEDSFIDNSEAYDEFVPSSITTKFGGFYVNSGLLQFRKASDSETDDLPADEATFDFTKKRRPDCEQSKPKTKRCKASEKMKSMRGVSKAVPDDSKVRKKKKAIVALSVTSMLRKFEREKEKQNMEEAKRVAAVISVPKTSLFPADAAGSGGPALTDPLLSLIGSTNDHALIQAANTVDFDIDLDSLLDASEERLSPESSFPTAAETSQTRANEQMQAKVMCDHEVQHHEPKINSELRPRLEPVQLQPEQSSVSAQCAPLPEGLPPALEENIGKLIEAAKTSEGESKLKFFSPDINSVLLDIELQCQEQSSQLRSKVYRHLSSFLPCSRDTLLKRVRKLLKQLEEPVNAEDPMQKLKESIARSMPEQIASFHESCRAYEETKTLKTAEEDNVEERGGRKGGPKKLFKWNEEIRECLSHVLKEKSDKYKREGKGDQAIEEFLKTFLENEVKALWPKGWMQSRVLLRESKKLWGLFHSLLGNKAKCLKKQSTGGASKTADVCSSFHGVPQRSEMNQRPDSGWNDHSHLSSCVSICQREGTASEMGRDEVMNVPLLVPKTDGPPDQTASESIVSRLGNLSGQEVTSEQPLALSQELLTEAFAKQWSTETDVNSPLLPPAPQPSPVSFPGNEECPIVFPHPLKIGDPSQLDAAQMLVISEALYNLSRVQEEGLST